MERREEDNRLTGLMGLAVGFALGIVLFSAGMFLFRNESRLCQACHEMDQAHQSFSQSIHGNQRHGVVPECAQCHPFSPAQAGKNLVLHFLPSIRSNEENSAYVSDRGCRSCHTQLLSESMRPEARVEHYLYLRAKRSSCLECHDEEGLFHREVRSGQSGTR